MLFFSTMRAIKLQLQLCYRILNGCGFFPEEIEKQAK